MKLPRRSFLHVAAGAAALPIVSRHAKAQPYPTRPMTMVVPYSAGGPTDTIARIMAERMRTSLGQIIIVENTTGAAGQIDIMIDQAANSIPQVRAGTIKAYAVTDKVRLAAAPDIPTVDEAGVPGLHISIWHALWMPKGAPKEIIAKLNGAVVDALADA